MSTTFFPALPCSSALEANLSGKSPSSAMNPCSGSLPTCFLLLPAYCPHLLFMLLLQVPGDPSSVPETVLPPLLANNTPRSSAQSLAMKHMFYVHMFTFTFTSLPSCSPHTPPIPVFGYWVAHIAPIMTSEGSNSLFEWMKSPMSIWSPRSELGSPYLIYGIIDIHSFNKGYWKPMTCEEQFKVQITIICQQKTYTIPPSWTYIKMWFLFLSQPP